MPSKIERTFKIVNTNVRTAFSSMKEVEQYITDNKPPIRIDYNSNGPHTYNILETTERYHTIPYANETLSKENKDKMWDIIIENLDKLGGDFTSFFYGLKYHYDPAPKKYLPYTISFPENFTSHEELSQIGTSDYEKQRQLINRILRENIDMLRADESKYEYLRVATDYKPCNAKAIQFKDGYMRGHCFLIREGDILFNGSLVYGRNVNSRGTYQLADKDFEKANKKKK